MLLLCVIGGGSPGGLVNGVVGVFVVCVLAGVFCL